VKPTAVVREHEEAPRDEPRWHATLAVVIGVILYMQLPPKLTFGPVWVAPLLIALILIPLSIIAPNRHQETRGQRLASIILIAILNFFNIVSVVLLVHDLVIGPIPKHPFNALDLLRAGAQIFTTNVLVYALWYWELDGGGPERRAHALSANEFRQADFLFPQMSMDRARIASAETHWKPFFLDYLYLAFTCALAFSPTDVMPLSRTAKMLMLVESVISFVTIALILARSINILA